MRSLHTTTRESPRAATETQHSQKETKQNKKTGGRRTSDFSYRLDNYYRIRKPWVILLFPTSPTSFLTIAFFPFLENVIPSWSLYLQSLLLEMLSLQFFSQLGPSHQVGFKEASLTSLLKVASLHPAGALSTTILIYCLQSSYHSYYVGFIIFCFCPLNCKLHESRAPIYPVYGCISSTCHNA